MTFNLTAKNNATAQRFEAQVGDHLAVIQYQRQGNRITFIHTEVPHALEGQGVGSRLARFALEYAKAQQLEVVPLCPFVRGYIKRHPEYQALVRHPIKEQIND